MGAAGNALAVPTQWAASTVSTFGTRYAPPLPDLTPAQSIEALVEGSEMSLLHEGSILTADDAWRQREGRRARYEGRRLGGTVVVHFIKKNMWYLETALALLHGEEETELEGQKRRHHPSKEPLIASVLYHYPVCNFAPRSRPRRHISA